MAYNSNLSKELRELAILNFRESRRSDLLPANCILVDPITGEPVQDSPDSDPVATSCAIFDSMQETGLIPEDARIIDPETGRDYTTDLDELADSFGDFDYAF